MNYIKAVIVFFAILLSFGTIASVPKYQKGVIYLATKDSSNRFKSIELDGQWRFFWQEFVHPDSIANRTDYAIISASKFWNKQKHGSTYYPSQGYGTFYLRIIVPDKDKWYGLQLKEIMSAAECYVNGRLLHKAGKPGISIESETPEYKTSPVFINVHSDTLDVVIHVSNFHHRNGGFFMPPVFGHFDSIMRSRLWIILLDMFLFASLVVIGLYHIYMFFLYKENKFFIWFGILSMSYAIRPLFSGAELLVYIFSPEWNTVYRLRYLSLYVAAYSFIMYFYTFKPDYFSRKLYIFIQIAFLLVALSVLALPAHIFTHFLVYFMVFMMVLIPYLAVIFSLKSRLQSAQDRLILTIVIIVTLAALNDYAVTENFGVRAYLIPYALLFFFLAQADIISRNLRVALRNIKELKDELQNQNQYLEDLVEKRHKSIVDAYNKIVEANEKLEGKSNIILRQRELVQNQRERLENTINFMPEMLFECSQNGRILMANQKFFDTTGFSKNQIKEGVNIFNLFVYEEELQEIKYELITKKSVRNRSYSIQDLKNNLLYVSISMSVLEEGGFNKGYRGVMIDISEQEVLRKKLLRLQMALEQSMNAVVMFDLSGNIEFANKQFLQLVNLSADEVVNKDISAFVNPLKILDLNRSLWSVLLNGQMWSGNIEYLSEKNKKMYLHTTLSPLYRQTEQIDAFLAIMEDVSENIENENARLELLKNLTIREKELTQSMNYARVLQNAILSSKESFDNIFKDYFIINKPLDIIGGDFYYIKSYGDKTVVAVADSTGHGTPGAIMSVLGVSLLNEILVGSENLDSGEILKLMRNRIISILAFDKDKALRDGIDMALCIIDKEKKAIQYAGANRPLIIVPDGQVELYKPNKQALGSNYALADFDNQCIYYRQSCVLYLFSDGITDQFSGVVGKKFGRNRLLEMIHSVKDLEMDSQKNKIIEIMQNWQGTEKQIDDVLLVGISL